MGKLIVKITPIMSMDYELFIDKVSRHVPKGCFSSKTECAKDLFGVYEGKRKIRLTQYDNLEDLYKSLNWTEREDSPRNGVGKKRLIKILKNIIG